MEVYDFGIRLKKLRKKRKMTQQEVADRLGKSAKTISLYENNTQTPRLEVLIELAVMYNASVDYILGFTDRTHLYIDDLSPDQQEAVLELFDVVRKRFLDKNKGNS